MMNFLSRSTPVYKSANAMQGAASYARPAAPSGLSGLFGSLLGRATPIYKTADGRASNAVAPSSSFWSLFAVTPSYKTAPAATVAEHEACEPELDESACALDPDQIVVL